MPTCVSGFNQHTTLLLICAIATLVHGQLIPTYDGYQQAKGAIMPEAAQPLYDEQYFANLPNFAPCVLTAQLQLLGGDNSRFNASTGARMSQISLGMPDLFDAIDLHSPSTLLLFNSTLLKGCADRTIFSPMYTGVPSQSANEFVNDKNLFYASNTAEERSGSIDVAYNNVRSRGTLVPLRGISDLLYGGILGECVAGIPSWQLPSGYPTSSGNSAAKDGFLTLSRLGDLLSQTFDALSAESIRDFLTTDQLGSKSTSSNSVKEEPGTGALLSQTPITLVLVGEDGSSASEKSLPDTSIEATESFVAFANSKLSETVSSNITTNAELILLLDALSANTIGSLISSCLRKQIRHNPQLYSLAYNGLPISIISGVLASDDATLGLKAFVSAAAHIIRSNSSVYFPPSASGGTRSFANYSFMLEAAIAPNFASYVLPRETNTVAASLSDHLQFEHYYTLGPAAVANMAAASSAPSGSDRATGIVTSLYESDGYSYYYYGNATTASSSSSASTPTYYALGALLAPFESVAQQWSALKQRAAFNAQQVLGAPEGWSVKSSAQVESLLFSSSASASVVDGRASMSSILATLRPAFEYHSKATMRLSNEAPVVSLTSAQFASHATSASTTQQQQKSAFKGRQQQRNTFHVASDVRSDAEFKETDYSTRLQQQQRPKMAKELSNVLESFLFEGSSSSPPQADGAATLDGGRKGPALPTFTGLGDGSANRNAGTRRKESRGFLVEEVSSSGESQASSVSVLKGGLASLNGQSFSNFYSSPICLETPSATCSPVGGLSTWATTTTPPKGYYDPVNVSTSSPSAEEQPTSFTASASKRFTPNGSIAIMVSSASTSSLFHDIIPSASASAADTAALLLILDSISRSLLPSVLYNGTLLRELLGLPVGTSTGSDDQTVLEALGQVYFFFFVGEDGAGFSGSGRLIKESLAFHCTDSSGSDSPNQGGIDCNTPFYWFTNFTRSISLDNFTHFIALDGVLDVDGQVEKSIHEIERSISDALSSSGGGAIFVSLPMNSNFSFYSYSDAQLDSESPSQRQVNSFLSQPSLANQPSGAPSSTQNSKPLAFWLNSSVFVTLTEGTRNISVSLSNNASVANTGLATNYSMMNVSYANFSGVASNSNVQDGGIEGVTYSCISLSTTIPPSSLWSFMLSAYGDISNDEAVAHRQQAEAAGSAGAIATPFTPHQWKSRSFTLLSAVPPDAKMQQIIGELGAISNESPSQEATISSKRVADILGASYFTGAATSNTLRTARSVSSSLDTFAAILTSRRSDTTRRNPVRLPATHRAAIKQRVISQMLAASADIVSNVIVGIIGAQLREAVIASPMQPAPSAALDAANRAIASVATLSNPLEAQRLFYCLAANTNCVYMQGSNYALGSTIPADSFDSAASSIASAGGALNTINSPSYYNGVFSYYYSMNPQITIAQAYAQDRLKSSYFQRAGVRNATTSVVDLHGRPCDPSAADTTEGACNVRYQRCMQDNNASSATGTNSAFTYSCYPLNAFFSHAFGSAIDYDLSNPSSASYIADWLYINGEWAQPTGCNGSSSTGGNSYTATPPASLLSPSLFISAQQVGALFFSLRMEVESYWYSGGIKDIAARVGLAASPALLWIVFGAGLGALITAIALAVVFLCVLEPKIFSKREGDQRERDRLVKLSRGATESKAFVPAKAALGEIRYATAADAIQDEGDDGHEDGKYEDAPSPPAMEAGNSTDAPAAHERLPREPEENDAEEGEKVKNRKPRIYRPPHEDELGSQ